jgi:cytochrome c oxidase subunit IV
MKNNRMKIRTIVFWIAILVFIDQAIKITINAYFLECRFDIILSLFEFRPTWNDKHSYVNSLLSNHFNVNLGLLFHTILFLIGGIVLLILYGFFRNNDFKNKKYLDFAFMFAFAGLICALSGNLIWENGTLDYILLNPLFVFDLKDLYLNCFVVLFVIFMLKNGKDIHKVKTKDLVLYVKNDVLKKQKQ